MEKRINICIASDDNYSTYACVLIASILKNSNFENQLFFYILDGGISEENKEKIKSLKKIKDFEITFIDVDKNYFNNLKNLETHNYITLPAYYRLKIGSLLRDIDKAIYFDCDIIVNCDLGELFNTKIDDYTIAGVKDINKRMLKKNPSYINSGVLLINLQKFRQENCEEKLFNYIKENFQTIKNGDQEVINEVFKNKIKILNDEFNVQSSNFTNRSSYTNNPKIIHFVSKKKPWHFASFSYHKKYYFKYLQLTPWKLDETQTKYWQTKNEIVSLICYLKYRPFFLLRPRFYKAIFYTYIKPFLKGEKIA